MTPEQQGFTILRVRGSHHPQGNPVPNSTRMTLDFIEQGDGQGQTMLFAENHDVTNWNTLDARQLAFGVSLDHVEPPPATTAPPLGFVWNAADLTASRPGSPDMLQAGVPPRPFSGHGDLFIAAFADGTSRAINTNINARVVPVPVLLGPLTRGPAGGARVQGEIGVTGSSSPSVSVRVHLRLKRQL